MKRHPYILASIIATLTAIVVWFIVPKKYTAYTKLSDEYKEVELSIGLNVIQAHVKNLMGSANEGINDMEVYSKVIKTEDFARCIASKQVAVKGITYGAYLNSNDTIEAIQDAIIYNYLRSQETLSIAFTDKDPVVASQMLDSVTTELQRIITRHRRSIIASALKNANREVSETRAKYDKAVHDYSRFAESHTKVKTPTMKLQEQALESEVKSAQSLYRKAREKQIRQQALSQRYQMAFTVIQDNTVPQTADNPLFGYILSFIVLALFFTYIILHHKNIDLNAIKSSQLSNFFSPWALTIGIWALILGLYYLLDTDLYPITSQFYYCLIIWIPVFCISAFVTYIITPANKITLVKKDSDSTSLLLFNILFIISLIITPLYVYKVMHIVMMFSSEDLMSNIRTLAVYGEGVGFLGYSNVLNQSLFVVAIWAYPRVPLWKIVVLAFACLLNSLAIMEKGTIFFVFVCIMFVLFEKRVIRMRSIVLAGIILVAFFYIFNLARASEGSDYQQNETLLDFFAMYALSPPVAFCQLQPEVTPQFGTNTFETIYLFLKRFGEDVVVKDKLQEFVFVPISTNVYTLFQPFYIDFGHKGIALFATIYGFISGWLYRLHTASDGFGRCMYTYIVTVLVLQFYQENIFLSMVFVIQFTFFVYILTLHDNRE